MQKTVESTVAVHEGDSVCTSENRSWHHATDHGIKVIQLVHCVAEQIVVYKCHRSWRNREGDTARALRRRADRGVQCHRSWGNLEGDQAVVADSGGGGDEERGEREGGLAAFCRGFRTPSAWT